MKKQEDFQLLGVIDGSVKAALEALGDELMNYLKEAGEQFDEKKEEPKHEKKSGPFMSIFDGFKEIVGSFSVKKDTGHGGHKKPTKSEILHDILNRKRQSIAVKRTMWNVYHHFKKQHDMLNW